MSKVIRIPNIDKYTQEIINGELILTPKKQYITENELLNMTKIKKSIIKECLIKKDDKMVSTSNKYRSILVDIWKYMPAKKILQLSDNRYNVRFRTHERVYVTSTFNFKLTNENGEKGYNWCEDIKMSFQSKDAEGTLKEIINMIKVNKFTIKLSIKLETGRIIHFKID